MSDDNNPPQDDEPRRRRIPGDKAKVTTLSDSGEPEKRFGIRPIFPDPDEKDDENDNGDDHEQDEEETPRKWPTPDDEPKVTTMGGSGEPEKRFGGSPLTPK